MKSKSFMHSLSLLAAVGLAGLTAALAADDAVPTQGEMRATVKDQPVDLPLKHTAVEAEISGFVTRVKVVQTFSNPYPDPIEAVYVFPLPQDAAVSDMQIRIGDRVVKGVIKKRAEAKQIYEDAKKAGKTAALLEQERPNIFMQSVANILPGNDILVEITYDEVLNYESGGYEFVFPMVVGPRFIPGNPVGQQGGGWAPDTDKVPDASRITPPVLKPGERNGHDISVKVTLNAGVPVRSVRSPSHEIVLTPEAKEGDTRTGPCEIRLGDRDTIPNKDFVLRYDVAGAKPEVGFLAHRGELGGFFLLMFQPPEAPAAADVTPKEMVFVMDTSGSMSGEPIALAKKAVRYALNNLNPNDTFQIIRFSESASPFAAEPLPATAENIRSGLSYINGLEGEGGTMMIEGIKAALDYPHRENRLRIVCFMTDGYIGNESEILAAIGEKLGENTRLFSFGVGSSVNRYLLDRMGDVGRGEARYILLNEKPEEAVKTFYERVRNPVLTHIRVDWQSLDVADLSPARIKDLFAGQPIFVLGRYSNPGRATVKVHGRIGGKDVTYDVPVALPGAEAANGAIAPLWARARIRELEAEQYASDNTDVEQRITELALTYRLMSQYTSFVAVEEKVVNEGGEVKTIQVPVEMPEGVSYEGVFGLDKTDAAMMPATAPVGGGLALRSFLPAGKSSRLAGRVQMAESVKDERFEPPVEQPAEPLKPFRVELAVTGADTVRITAGGEIWKSSADGANTLVARLRQSELRELWGLLNAAFKETAAAVAGATAGTLKIEVLDDAGQAGRTVEIKLGGEGAQASEAWNRVVEYVLRISR